MDAQRRHHGEYQHDGRARQPIVSSIDSPRPRLQFCVLESHVPAPAVNEPAGCASRGAVRTGIAGALDVANDASCPASGVALFPNWLLKGWSSCDAYAVGT